MPTAKVPTTLVQTRRRVISAALLGSLALCGACTSMPRFEDINGGPDTVNGAPRLSNARGPLTAKQSKAILDKLRRQTPDVDILGRHLAFTEAIAASPLTVGNSVTLLYDGGASFRAIFRLIAAAKTTINMEYFTFEDVAQDGRTYCRPSTRETGCRHAGESYLRQRGFEQYAPERVRSADRGRSQYRPVQSDGPLQSQESVLSQRPGPPQDPHFDGAAAIIGGVNISGVYASNVFKSDDAKDTPRDLWRDTDVQLEGPAVADLQRLFVETWQRQRGAPLKQAGFFPERKASGNQVVGIIGSTPTKAVPIYYISLLSAIRNAESRVWLTAAYFVPTRQEVDDMIAAARRGADVRLMLPGHSDSAVSLNIGRSHYEDLLDAGVKIYEIHDVILHSKTAVVDGVWSAVGSSNFDGRSILFNDEVDAIVLGRETGAQMERAFEANLKIADQIDREAWSRRPLAQRMKEHISRVWSYWL